jgi:hypothetical protein
MKFSYFKKPIVVPKGEEKKPYRDIDLADLYTVIKGTYHKGITEAIRKTTGEAYKKMKRFSLDFITPAGTFSVKADKGLIKPSGFISVDLDHLEEPEAVKARLAEFPGMQIIFTSPSNKGVKCILTDPQEEDSYSLEFKAVAKKIHDRFGLKPDSTSDISRAAFVCHDPLVWISDEVKLMILERQNPHITELKNRLKLELI